MSILFGVVSGIMYLLVAISRLFELKPINELNEIKDLHLLGGAIFLQCLSINIRVHTKKKVDQPTPSPRPTVQAPEDKLLKK